MDNAVVDHETLQALYENVSTELCSATFLFSKVANVFLTSGGGVVVSTAVLQKSTFHEQENVPN